MTKKEISIEEMMKAGMHFGHQTFRREPKMDPYIFGVRSGVHIIDLTKTAPMLQRALDFLTDVVKGGGQVVLVGTKRQASSLVEKYAQTCGMPYVSERWLGGLLTNFDTMSRRLKYLRELDDKYAKDDFKGMTKKERVVLDRHYKVLNTTLGGVKYMENIPSAIFVIDANKDRIAIKEANKLGVPVVALADTNTNPEGIDYPIPANDDAKSAIEFVLKLVAESCGTKPAPQADKISGADEVKQEEPEVVK
ncbi:MAG: 30S ribosomal protein S2 [Patescibacteria group bacterium]|nr:30S ribosomal protein S2 [Patescibacteria group bacterium]